MNQLQRVIRCACYLALMACSAAGHPTESEPRPIIGNLQSPWENAKLRGVKFRAIGQEPSWFLEIKDGQEIYLFKAFGAIDRRLPFVDPTIDQDRRLTVFTYAEDGIEIRISGRACRDTMSGETFASTVTVELEDELLRGCGRALL